jgi:hypothetical protein
MKKEEEGGKLRLWSGKRKTRDKKEGRGKTTVVESREEV